MNERTTIMIPATIEEAKIALGGLGALLTAKGWERAAIVYAFTKETRAGRPRKGKSSEITQLSCNDFAKLGIHGLRGGQAVREHRANWEEAMANGWVEAVAPGDEVVLPAEPYPPSPRKTGAVRLDPTATAAENAAAIRSAINAHPDLADEVDKDAIQRIGKDTKKYARATRVHQEHHPKPDKKDKATGTDLLWMTRLGEAIYASVQNHHRDVRRLAEYIGSHMPIPDQFRTEMQEVRDDLSKSIRLIREYDDLIAEAMGEESIDAVARRLLRE